MSPLLRLDMIVCALLIIKIYEHFRQHHYNSSSKHLLDNQNVLDSKTSSWRSSCGEEMRKKDTSETN